MEQQQDHYEYRLFKRTRQACINCRRKKIRCSGDRPVCTYCERLRQKCAYAVAPKSEGHEHGLPRPDIISENKDDAPSLFSLESRISSLEGTIQSLVHLLTNEQGAATGSKDTSPSRKGSVAEDPKWLLAASDMTLSSAADVYFQYCYNQPYCLFHEQSFRQRLVSRAVPEYLCLALIATASRFSRSSRPLPHYADQAWELVMKRSTANLDSMESLALAQTTHLLCVIDYSDGQCRAAWIKLGLAIRIAQCYRLNTEPDARLRPEIQEEYRRTFWSIYLLDKLMSCGRERHPGLQDRDCQLRVPCSEKAFRDCVENRGPTLDQLTGDTPAVTTLPEHSHFSIIILMASTLNRVVQYVLRWDSRLQADVPWATASQYSALESTLWRLELNYGMLDSLSAVWQQTLTSDGTVDPRVAGPLVYGRALFHLAGCLLHHPFLLQHRLAESASRTPPGFLSKAWTSSRSHATALTTLQETENLGSVTVSCFRGYCSMVAGSVHLLFASDSNKEVSEASVRRYEECRGLLMKLCRYWESSRRMFVMLERLYEDRTRYRQSLDLTQTSRSMGEKPRMAVFWDSVDNWVPSSRSPSPERGPERGPIEQVQSMQFNASMDFFELAPLEPWETGNTLLEVDFSNGAEFR
ncbi:hypothetical protein NLU13_3972 [Sarocladium strictum]|uniref:Zn(2)-C6 fungal-type domain-containing protein n=1 Tax=Sarocladium strictum TaxID=5046 RepID=A0AA39GI10_SARSR|nr:hypothetical protein NLU13_3972 [Sarocladium strictum]